MVEVPPEADSERPHSGGGPRLATADPLRCGALKLPLTAFAPGAGPSRGARAAAPSTFPRAIAAACVLALILVGGLAHFHSDTVEHREPHSAADTIEAWLRHMTVTRAVTVPHLQGPPPLDWPEGL